jgi:hypothetical protein
MTTGSTGRPISSGAGRPATGSNGTISKTIVVEGDQAFVTYQCTASDGKSFRNTEFFWFEGDKIRSIDVYFGATYQKGVFVKQQS